MADTAGQFILIIMTALYGGGVTSETMPSLAACKAAQVQLEVSGLRTICIAKDVRHD